MTEAELAGFVKTHQARGALRQGMAAWTLAQVTAPARHRLYKATATEISILGPGDSRLPLNERN